MLLVPHLAAQGVGQVALDDGQDQNPAKREPC
jgi:hypothetical protein